MSIIEKHNWTNPNVTYVRDSYINEWDIESAGFSVLREHQYLSEDQIDKLSKMSKVDRNIQIGIMQQKDKNLVSLILNTLRDIRVAFYEANNLHDSKILSIKKDAIVVVDSTVKVTNFGKFFKFNNKGSFTSFARFKTYEFYYNSITGNFVVKGLGDEYHLNTALDCIKDVLQYCESADREGKFRYLQKMQRDYLERRAPEHYYKDPISGQFMVDGFDLTVDDISSFGIENVNINNTYQEFILPFIQAVI